MELVFHQPESPVTVALFRFVWGLLIAVDGWLMLSWSRIYFGPEGWLSAARHREIFGRGRFSLFNMLPETDGAARSAVWLLILSALSLAAGFYTRTSALICFVTMVSLHHRDPCVFHSGDSIMRLLTLLLIFSQAGTAWSVDELLVDAKLDGIHSAVVATTSLGNHDAEHRATMAPFFTRPRETVSPWCVRLMQIQICIVYLRTVHWKLRGKLWWEGTAAYFPTQVNSFQRIRLPRLLTTKLPVRFATWGTLVAEVAIGGFIWLDELRYPVLVAGLLRHLIFELFLNLQLFSFTMVVGLTLFIPPADLERWVAILMYR